jgi:hypothetical protein
MFGRSVGDGGRGLGVDREEQASENKNKTITVYLIFFQLLNAHHRSS